jgi:HEPN domain-containing protein
MNQAEKEILAQWIEKANHDLIAAALIIDSNPIILDIACFHCQQAIEKFLKAFLLFNEEELIKTHNLNILLKNCVGIDNDFIEIDIKDLNQFAVRSRYPDEFISPELSVSQEYYQTAVRVKEMVIDKIRI